MIVASGFVVTKGLNNVKRVMNELRARGMEGNHVEQGKVTFIIEKKTMDAINSELDSLRSIEYIKNVCIIYYSFEGNDKCPDSENNELTET